MNVHKQNDTQALICTVVCRRVAVKVRIPYVRKKINC